MVVLWDSIQRCWALVQEHFLSHHVPVSRSLSKYPILVYQHNVALHNVLINAIGSSQYQTLLPKQLEEINHIYGDMFMQVAESSWSHFLF